MVVVHARTRSLVPAPCTGCGRPSGWCHSRYVGRLADASLGGRPMLIELNVRRLSCENASCDKVTFTDNAAPFINDAVLFRDRARFTDSRDAVLYRGAAQPRR
ncbi:transposase family protein [Streptomyces sp. NPDC058632]|uniref:transposase family protein n=1 Tax=unclassified Streptomyces TaxID=2593676 RepID=UPI003652BA01